MINNLIHFYILGYDWWIKRWPVFERFSEWIGAKSDWHEEDDYQEVVKSKGKLYMI